MRSRMPKRNNSGCCVPEKVTTTGSTARRNQATLQLLTSVFSRRMEPRRAVINLLQKHGQTELAVGFRFDTIKKATEFLQECNFNIDKKIRKTKAERRWETTCASTVAADRMYACSSALDQLASTSFASRQSLVVTPVSALRSLNRRNASFKVCQHSSLLLSRTSRHHSHSLPCFSSRNII